MIVTSHAGEPLLEIVRDRHPQWGTCLRVRQNRQASVLVPLSAATALADCLVDAAERLEART